MHIFAIVLHYQTFYCCRFHVLWLYRQTISFPPLDMRVTRRQNCITSISICFTFSLLCGLSLCATHASTEFSTAVVFVCEFLQREYEKVRWRYAAVNVWKLQCRIFIAPWRRGGMGDIKVRVWDVLCMQ